MKASKQKIDYNNAWKKSHYKTIGVTLHRRKDAKIIDYIEGRKEDGEKTTAIIRDILEAGVFE